MRQWIVVRATLVADYFAKSRLLNISSIMSRWFVGHHSGTTVLYFVCVVAILLWLIFVPLGELILNSFRTGHPASPGPFTFDNYITAYTNRLTYEMILNTLLFGAAATAISICLALSLAWLIERTDMPLRNLCWIIALVPMAIPGLLFSIAYVCLLSPKSGLINLFLRNVLTHLGFEFSDGPINIYSLGGMVFLEGVRGVTTVLLLIVGSFRMMDPVLEEASWTAGAGNWKTTRNITLPVLLPAILAAVIYSFMSSLESLEIPLVVGMPGRIFVYSTMIYFTARGPIVNHGMGGALAFSYFFIALILVFFYQRATLFRAERFATVSGKDYRPRLIKLGAWRYGALALFLVYFTVTVLLPVGALVWASLIPYFQPPSAEALAQVSVDSYRRIATEPNVSRAIWNTILITFSTATGTVVLAFAISWLVVRTRLKGRFALDSIAFASQGIPGTVIALSFIFVYLQPPFRELNLYGTVWIVSLALVTQFIAFATRTTNAAITQIHKDLEEAGEACGASQIQVLWQIIFPLIRPAFIAAWIWVAAHAVRVFTVPVMLASRENQTLSVLMWQRWDIHNDSSGAAAIGVIVIFIVASLTLAGRVFIVRGFRQG